MAVLEVDNRARQARIESIGEDGSFRMTLATDGEASDGDILSIEGGQIPERMPLLLSHYNDPTATAGSVVDPIKETLSSPKRLVATGKIELGGDGALADVRRDVAYMIGRGHIGAVSVRWDALEGGEPPVSRTSLPTDHHAFVDGDKENSARKRGGLFWPQWRALEGSIVALGADPQALIGRAEQTTGEVRQFWQEMARGLSARRVPVVARPLRTMLASLRRSAAEARASGLELADLINAVCPDPGDSERHGDVLASDFAAVTLGGRTFFLPTDVADLLSGQDEEPEPDLEPAPERVDPPEEIRQEQPTGVPFDADEFVSVLMNRVEARDVRVQGEVQRILDAARGKVNK